jgi:arsenate reductase
MSVKIFHNPRCSKSRATLALLHDRGFNPEVILYLETPPAEEQLRDVLTMLGKSPRELMRKSQQEYQDNNLDDDALTDDELVNAMLNHPILIERPIVMANGKAAIGRPPESVLEIL